MRSLLLLLTAGALAAAEAPPAQKAPSRYYYDLGPAAIDVSTYPKEAQDAYPLFQKTCSACHTLARAINCPYVSAAEWQRYLLRMHRKTRELNKPESPVADEKLLVDFLIFDAHMRKVEQRAAFEALTAKLKDRFEHPKPARPRKKPAKAEAPPPGGEFK